jgi:ABC-2 type transport system ATP-binding protein
MKEITVEIKNLERRFGDFVAVNRVSLEVYKGEIFGFLGPNGAGKSTTIRMLCGILAPTGGTGTVAGFDIRTEPEKIKSRIGYMSQKFSLYDDLTPEENIDFYGGVYRIPEDKKRERKEWVIEMAGLQEHRRSRTSTLSGGWKQRLSLGCAILHEPSILFLDEPTAGVDPVSRRQFWDLIYDLSEQGVTIFVTTHYMDEAEYCDRIALIYRGELTAMGSPAILKRDFMAEEVLEVDCEHPQERIAQVEKLPGVKEAALFGRGLHVISEDSGLAARHLRELLGPAARIAAIAPSLEDVFVSVIQARDRAEHPQGEVRQ